ncbi:PREDICTED: uncharacterized protein LOC106119483 [Papilio xuthus]|uniref:Uncharacterized protein LOC106119483 n=1 Tax=Papilio xuthus TaxID=66420 RepID=A0AAJ7EB01_PAPXU|nr:PREDICTED: uncharacterized protein LOC106119483 [Papilio xuthus]
MLHLFALTTIISSVVSQEILGVNYTFDDDFNYYFDNKSCHGDRKWHLIEYQTLNIFTGNIQSNNGIIAKNNSCVSSFPIVFFLNSVVEVNVYVRLSLLMSGLSVIVYDELDTPVVIHGYNKSSENYTPGWNTMYIAINRNINGYINLQGRITDNEIIIIDSFNHVVKTEHHEEVQWKSTIDKSESLLLENLQLPRDIIDDYWIDGSNDDINNENGSGDNEGSGDNIDDVNSTTPSDITDVPDTPAFQFWNLWTIILVAVGSLILVTILIVIAYFIGKRRGEDDNTAMIESLEPQSRLRIPRINSIYPGFRLNRFR